MEGTTGLTTVGTGITFIIEQVVDILALVTGSPVLSLGIAAWCIGLGISFFKRLV